MSAFTEAHEQGLKGLKFFSTGPYSKCKDCQRNWGFESEEAMEKACQEDKVNDEGGFSRSPCDVCGATLAGNRYDAHAFTEDGDELVHLSVCEDCLIYDGTGDEPENWEG